MKRGRKKGDGSKYDADTAAEICRLMREELLSGRAAARTLNIPISTVYEWLSAHKDFAEHYAKAREALVDGKIEEIYQISEDRSRDIVENTIEHIGRDGEVSRVETRQASDNTAVNRDRLIIDTRKWAASRLFPQKYGEITRTELTGKDGGPIEQRQVDAPPQETRAQWEARVAAAMQAPTNAEVLDAPRDNAKDGDVDTAKRPAS